MSRILAMSAATLLAAVAVTAAMPQAQAGSQSLQSAVPHVIFVDDNDDDDDDRRYFHRYRENDDWRARDRGFSRDDDDDDDDD
jgi:hypothetical protein